MRFPHAGVSLRLPMGFERRTLREPFDVLQARRANGERTALALTLSVFPVEPKTGADAFADAMLAELARDPAVGKLQVRGASRIKVAGLDATAVRVGYRSRGAEMVAIRIHFIREQAAPPCRLCYFMDFRTSAARQTDLQETVSEVVKTVRLPAVRHPWEAPGRARGPRAVHPRCGLAIRPPRGWHVNVPGAADANAGAPAAARDVFRLGQVDYLAGGALSMEARVLAGKVAGEGDGNRCARRVARECLGLVERGTVVREGPAQLLARGAHQLILRLRGSAGAPGDGGPTGPTGFVVIRGACMPADGLEGARRSFAVILRCRAADANSAAAVMDFLAGGLERVQPATAPTSAPATAPTTAPATMPATVPARWPVTAPTSQPAPLFDGYGPQSNSRARQEHPCASAGFRVGISA